MRSRTHRTIMLYEGGAVCSATLQERERARCRRRSTPRSTKAARSSDGRYRAALASRARRAIAAVTEWLADSTRCSRRRRPARRPRSRRRPAIPSCCTLWSLLGFPAHHPAGRGSADGLPLGMQLAATAGTRRCGLLSAAAWCEERIAFRGSAGAMKRAKQPARRTQGRATRSRARRCCARAGAHGKTTRRSGGDSKRWNWRKADARAED